MKKKYFELAKPIWANGKEEELNCCLFFRTIINKKGLCKINVTANNFYRIFINGKLKFYGPSRDAHFYYRVDEYKVNLNQSKNIIVIEVSGSNCYSFYTTNTRPFLLCEIKDEDNNVLSYTSDNEFLTFNNDTRIRKVTRFSYQRPFSESYVVDQKLHYFFLDGINAYTKLETKILENVKLDKRIVHYPKLSKVKFSLEEFGSAFINENKKIYEDRYQTADFLKLFPKSEWEIDSNKVASQLDFKLGQGKSKLLKNMEFNTYSNDVSLTGFINLNVNVKKEALIYILFDEVDIRDNNNPNLIGITFYRNTTHNCVTYSLKPGYYDLITFEPYTLKNARVVALSGEVFIHSFNLIKYENKDVKIKYEFENEKINLVLDAAINTFKQNAVDLLTDCPSRERASWLCDSFFSGQAEPIITGINLVEEAFLDNYSKCDKSQVPYGMIPMCYPADFPDKGFIANWSLWYILEIYNYINRGGNKSILKSSISNIKGLLNYFENFENEYGLLENLQGWIFVEWSKANDLDFVKGINYPSNMLYSEALVKAGELLKDKSLIKKGDELKKTIHKFSFNGEFFIDNSIRNDNNEIVATDHTTETCQYYAFYFNVANKEEDSDLFNTMIKYFGEYRDDKTIYPKVYKSNVLMGNILRLMILNRYNLSKQVFKESIDYFYKMATKTGTLWEFDSVYASLNHCFTSFLVNIILRANFGLESIDYQNKIIYMKNNALLENANLEIPIKNDKFIITASEGKLKYKLPKDYKIIWK